jgi:hypothetical protein
MPHSKDKTDRSTTANDSLSISIQYRNKYIHVFDAVANHFDTFGCHVRWNYFDSGHGKGPCDGLGGTSKRIADEASRSGRVLAMHVISISGEDIECDKRYIPICF